MPFISRKWTHLSRGASKQGDYAIYFRGYKANEGIIEADVRSVDRAQLAIVARRIGEVINQEKKA